MLIYLLILRLVQAHNNTNFTGDPILPNEGQGRHTTDIMIGEAALGGMIPSIIVIILIAIIRIVRVYRLSQQAAESSIKPDENVDFNQVDEDIKEV